MRKIKLPKIYSKTIAWGFIFLLTILTACKVKPKVNLDNSGTFYKMLGAFGGAEAYDVVENPDGTLLVAGSINIRDFADDGSEFIRTIGYLAKTDALGNLLWEKKLNARAAKAIYPASSGGWYVGIDSTFQVGNTSYTNFALMKMDNDGNVQWARKYPNNTRFEKLKGIVVFEDIGNIYLLGDFSVAENSTQAKIYLVITDLNGNFINQSEYGTFGVVTPTTPGPNLIGNALNDKFSNNYQILVSGTTEFSGDKKLDIRVLRMRFTGGSLVATADLTNLFGGIGDDFGEQVITTADRNLLVTGTISAGENGGKDIYVAKIRIAREFGDIWSGWDIEWEKNLGGGGDDEGKTITQMDNGEFLVAGNVATIGNAKDILLYKLDFFGNVVWEKQFGGTKDDKVRRIKQLANGDILILGTIGFEQISMIALIRTDKNGNLIR